MVGDKNKLNVSGYVAPGWERIRSIFEQNLIDGLDIGASLCIYHRGKRVVDLCGGSKGIQMNNEPYTFDTLQLIFSVSKGIVAAAIALCVHRGWLDYNAPVSKYWPEFSANGKEYISVGEILSHRAGLPCVDIELTIDDVCNWSRMISLLGEQKPFWQPGTTHGYHPITFGFIAGELIRRVDPHHRSCAQFIRDELDPEFYIGVHNDELEARIAPLIRKTVTKQAPLPSMNQLMKNTLTCNSAFPLEYQTDDNIVFNSPQIHRAEIPAANGITNARSLARIYALLITDIEEDNQTQKRLIDDNTLNQATISATPSGERDQILFGATSNFAKGGFHLYGDYFKAFGTGVFGHKGIGGSCALAYPPYEIAFAHVCNQLDFSVPILDPRSVGFFKAIETILQHEDRS